MSSDPKFELPKHIERYLAAISKLYGQEGELLLQQIVVNAKVRVHEGWSHDNWNGGTYGHALYLAVPEPLFLSAAKQKADIQKRIERDLNDVHNVQNEFVEQVFLEMELAEDSDWRRESGVLVAANRMVPPEATKRIWVGDGFRLFLSHKSKVKVETAELAGRLGLFGVSSFVAHKDIRPTTEWRDEIENALFTMEGFVALVTEDFHDSEWTDQEVGFAVARRVPIIAVRMGSDPYGFIGKFQALSCSWEQAAGQIARLLINHPRMLDSYISAIRNCGSFDAGNTLAGVLTHIDRLSDEQAERLVVAYNDNTQARFSFGFDGSKPSLYGPGLVAHLNRLSKRQFRWDKRDIVPGV